VGAAVGASVGLGVGVAVGARVGLGVGTAVGACVGTIVRSSGGSVLGTRVGLGVGELVAATVGSAAGAAAVDVTIMGSLPGVDSALGTGCVARAASGTIASAPDPGAADGAAHAAIAAISSGTDANLNFTQTTIDEG
jgi:hypothetical protein